MRGLLIALLVLLNIGGIATVIFNVGQGHPRWFTDLLMVVALNALGLYLLRVAREDG